MGGVFGAPTPRFIPWLPPVWPFERIARAHRLDESNAFLYLGVNPYHPVAAAGFLPSAY
jgi:hypothetical protein